ncbi:hypothetical protein ACBJ59_48450 [Nonomuraea sp. MTCD27]|uniref:hypothetical protein n=1 Tax=Nonomuraea sp. MTCD27 TaxID=1676747 RepID=UPI0035C2369F
MYEKDGQRYFVVDGGAGRAAPARGRARAGLRAGVRAAARRAGAPIPEEEAERRLRFARVVRVSIEGNAGFCRGLLRTRYAGAESSS